MAIRVDDCPPLLKTMNTLITIVGALAFVILIIAGLLLVMGYGGSDEDDQDDWSQDRPSSEERKNRRIRKEIEHWRNGE